MLSVVGFGGASVPQRWFFVAKNTLAARSRASQSPGRVGGGLGLLRRGSGCEVHHTRSLCSWKKEKSNVVVQEDGEAGSFSKVFDDQMVLTKIEKKRSVQDIVQEQIDHLLPKYYESSVSKTYVGYVKWSMVASVVGTVSSVLSMQSLLYAVGLGQGAVPTAAALNWILKDGLGQLGGVLFASMINQRFDAEPKRWRFKSAALLDISILIEVVTPMFPQYFLPLASVANIGKNIGWLSASASRAGIHRSFMKVENLADITGKAGSQTIASSVIGTGLGIGVSSVIGQSTTGILAATVAFSCVHLFCTSKALDNVSISTFNLQRLWLSLRPALDYSYESNKEEIRNNDNQNTVSINIRAADLRNPEQVAPQETYLHFGKLSSRRFGTSILEQKLLPSMKHCNDNVQLSISPSLEKAFDSFADFEKAKNVAIKRGDKHMVSVTSSSSDNSSFSPCVNLLYFESADSRDLFRGMVHAILTYQTLVASDSTFLKSSFKQVPIYTRANFSEEKLEELMIYAREQDWDVENLFFESHRGRLKIEN